MVTLKIDEPFKVVCDETNNTSEDLKENRIVVDVYFNPPHWPWLNFIEIENE